MHYRRYPNNRPSADQINNNERIVVTDPATGVWKVRHSMSIHDYILRAHLWAMCYLFAYVYCMLFVRVRS